MILPLLGLAAGALSAPTNQTSSSTLKIEEAVFDGKPAFRLSNNTARLVVSPHLGRVVEYGLTEGPNVLYSVKSEVGRDGYRNVGGDMVWYGPESFWKGVPDPAWDGTPMKVEKLKDGIRLTSERGKYQPLRLVREIRLDANGPRVTFVNRMTNEGGEPITASLRQVTQLASPAEVRLPRRSTASQPRGYAVLQGRLNPQAARVESDQLRIVLHPSQSFKYGSRGGMGTVAADVARLRFQSTSPIARGGRYPEQDSAKIVYTAPASVGFARIEHLAPLEALEPRQVQQQVVTWNLAPLSN